MHFDAKWLQKILPEAVIIQGSFDRSFTFCVDSRELEQDHLFFALSGNKVDGHDFLKVALEKGAGVFVASNKKLLLDPFLKELSKEKIVILVPDPLHALIALASAWRSRFIYPVAAITGSVGKTTTKELTAHIVASSGKKFLVGQGNLNTQIGVALTISRMSDEYEGALFEVGISKQGEMAKIVAMLKPTTALITCIAHSHMEGLGSLSAIAYEKRMIFSQFSSDNIGIINGDQSLLAGMSYSHPIVKFGFKITNNIQARKIKELDGGGLSFILKLYDKKYGVSLSENHRGMLQNVIASVALAHQLAISDQAIVKALEQIPVRKRRFELCSLKNYRGIMIDDCYNASPESMKAALNALESMKAVGKKIAIIGDMLELGDKSAFWHRQIGRFLRKISSLHHIILVGDNVAWIEKTAPSSIKIERVSIWQDAVSKLSATLENDAVVLVKGSRGMQLHNVIAEFVDTQVRL